MALAQKTEDYMKESIDYSLGLPISSQTLELKLRASENDRNRLQDQIFVFQGRLNDSHKRVDQYRAEAMMNAQGLRKCIEEKEAIVADYANLSNHCETLEKECMLYERDLEKVMESCDELGKENEELRARLNDDSSLTAFAVAEIETLQKDNEHLRINLIKAEEEVKVLFEENRLLDKENKKLVRKIHREKYRHGSGSKPSPCSSSKFQSSDRRKKHCHMPNFPSMIKQLSTSML